MTITGVLKGDARSLDYSSHWEIAYPKSDSQMFLPDNFMTCGCQKLCICGLKRLGPCGPRSLHCFLNPSTHTMENQMEHAIGIGTV